MDTRFRDSLSGYKVDQVNQFSLVYNEAVSFYFGLYHMGLPRLSEYKGGILPERERERAGNKSLAPTPCLHYSHSKTCVMGKGKWVGLHCLQRAKRTSG